VVYMVKDITLEPHRVAELNLSSQEHPPASVRVPDNCTYLFLNFADFHINSQDIIRCLKGFLITVQIYLFQFETKRSVGIKTNQSAHKTNIINKSVILFGINS